MARKQQPVKSSLLSFLPCRVPFVVSLPCSVLSGLCSVTFPSLVLPSLCATLLNALFCPVARPPRPRVPHFLSQPITCPSVCSVTHLIRCPVLSFVSSCPTSRLVPRLVLPNIPSCPVSRLVLCCPVLSCLSGPALSGPVSRAPPCTDDKLAPVSHCFAACRVRQEARRGAAGPDASSVYCRPIVRPVCRRWQLCPVAAGWPAPRRRPSAVRRRRGRRL